jgi:small subunit ribosomal protein S1
VAAVLSLIFLSWNLLLQAFGTLGGAILFTAFSLYLFSSIPHFQRIGSSILQSLSWIRKAELASVRLAIEGSLNESRATINSEAQGAMPFPIKVEWVKDETPEAFVDKYKGEIVVRMRHHKYEPRNLAYATIESVSKGFLPMTRIYLDGKVSKSIDFTITKKMLSELENTEALDYFLAEVVQPESNDAELRTYLTIMESLNEDGVFTRIFVRELVELGRKLYPRYDQEACEGTRKLTRFMKKIAERKKGERNDLCFREKWIKLAIMLVAEKEKFFNMGTKPYKQWAEVIAEKGYATLYVLAGGIMVGPASMVIKELEKSPKLEMVGSETYIGKHEGELKKKICGVFKVKFH